MNSYTEPNILVEPLLFHSKNGVKYRNSFKIQFSRKINIDFIRHGESEINAKGLITGNIDSALTDKGRQQALKVGKNLKHQYEFAFTSTLRRAYETLQIAIESNQINVNNIRFDYRLNERNLGVLQGTPSKYISEYGHGNLDYSPKKGESYNKIINRCVSFLDDLAFMVEYSNIQNILISTHVGPLRMFTSILNNVSNSSDMLAVNYNNGEIFRVEVKTITLNKTIIENLI